MKHEPALIAVKAFRTAVWVFFVACILGAPHATAQAPVVGFLGIGSPAEQAGWDRTFGDGLRKLGYDVGRTLVIEYRRANGDISRYPVLARELVERKPAVIVATCGPSLRAIREVSRTLRVIANCADESNFLGEVASLSRPGGHTTGVSFLAPESVCSC